MPATADGARQRADFIRKYLGVLTGEVSAMADRLARAYELRDWEILGCGSWANTASASSVPGIRGYLGPGPASPAALFLGSSQSRV